MNRIDKLNKVFADCAAREWKNITDEEHRQLIERRDSLNSNMEWTDEAIGRIRALNIRLKEKEKNGMAHAEELHSLLEKWIQTKQIDDYVLTSSLWLFNNGIILPVFQTGD